MTTGQIVGGAVGAFFGGALGAQIGITLGGLVDPPKGPTIEGPRLSDLSVQTSTYGVGVPYIIATAAVSGNVFWLENNQLKEVARDDDSGGKGGGGSQTTRTYEYFATFAVAVNDAEIADVLRVWVGPDLISNPASTDTETLIATAQFRDGIVYGGNATVPQTTPQPGTFRVYFGKDDQAVDPRMEADLGVGATPAYRGVAYIVFYDWPLAKYSNSLQVAQVKAEVAVSTSSGAASLLNALTLTSFNDSGNYDEPTCPFISPAQSVIYSPQYDKNGAAGPDLEVWRQKVGINSSRQLSIALHSGVGDGLGSPEIMYGESDVPVTYWNANGGGVPPMDYGGGLNFARKNDRVYRYRISQADVWDVINQTTINISGAVILWITIDDAGNLYILENSRVYIYDEDLSFVSSFLHGLSASLLQSIRWYDNYIYITYDPADGRVFRQPDDQANTTWESFSTTATSNPSGTSFSFAISGGIYMRYYLDSTANESHIDYFKMPFDDSALVPLSTVVSTELQRSKYIAASDIDVSLLTSNVRGMRTAGIQTIRSILGVLQTAYLFDLIPSGYKLKCVPRGQSSVKTITDGELDARLSGAASGVELPLDREMDSQLPRKVIVRSLDANREYEQNEQYSPEKLSSESVNIRDVDLPVVLSVDESAQLAEIIMYASWRERIASKLTLGPLHRNLEPSDVITVESDSGTFVLRIDEIEYTPDGLVDIRSARVESASSWASSASGGAGVQPGGTISYVSDSELVLLDLPLIRDADDTPSYGIAMAGETSGWPGGSAYISNDNGQTFAYKFGFPSPVTLGFARDALSAHSGSTIDRDSTVTVDLIVGNMTLSSVTEAQMMTGNNWFAYGADGRWELCRFVTATLNSDGSYALSNLLRGLRGTEQYTGTHLHSDYFVLLDDLDIGIVGADIQSLAISRLYRGATVGQDLADVANTSFTYQGVNLKPLSPVHIAGSESAGDWTITWDNRSRLNTTHWKTGTQRPLGETSESYEIDITDETGAVVRTLTATTQTVDYTSAQQTTDFGSAQKTIFGNIYMMSAVVGRGSAGVMQLSTTPKARYWRLVNIDVPTAGSFLEISEFEFYEFDKAASNSEATVTAQTNPDVSGTLSQLVDNDTSTRPIWNKSTAENASFWIEWDFGIGNEKQIIYARQAGYSDSGRFMEGFEVEYSDDGATWTSLVTQSGLSYPGHQTYSDYYLL